MSGAGNGLATGAEGRRLELSKPDKECIKAQSNLCPPAGKKTKGNLLLTLWLCCVLSTASGPTGLRGASKPFAARQGRHQNSLSVGKPKGRRRKAQALETQNTVLLQSNSSRAQSSLQARRLPCPTDKCSCPSGRLCRNPQVPHLHAGLNLRELVHDGQDDIHGAAHLQVRLVPHQNNGDPGEKDGASESTSKATPLPAPAPLQPHVLPGSRPGSLPTLLCKVQNSFPASHGWEHPSGETDCLILLTLSPSNNIFRSL